MATKVIMPKQGLQMTEGFITKWMVPEGGKVTENEPLFEMETDKLTITIDAPASGTLLKIIKKEGETVPITETIAVIGEAGEDITFLTEILDNNEEKSSKVKTDVAISIQATKYNQPEKICEGIFATPRARERAREIGIDFKDVCGSGPDGLIIERDVLSYSETVNSKKVKFTPVAEKIAKENNVDIEAVSGTGTSGRIMKDDVEKYIFSKSSAHVQSRCGKVEPFKGMRKVISDRMTESLRTMAQANHRMKVDMTEAIKLREQLKQSGIKVSYNDILIKVVSKALLEFPAINSSMVEEGILLKDYVNMGIAVSVPNGLIVPNIKDADYMSLQEISEASSDLIQKALSGKLSADEYAGGTFTITNLGMFDIDEFTAIVNPPESAILAVGKIEKVPVVEDDKLSIRPLMILSLSYDHRIIDGAMAAQFLQRVKQLLNNPYLLL